MAVWFWLAVVLGLPAFVVLFVLIAEAIEATGGRP